MRSSMMGFEVQKRSLQVAQKALDIVAHNIANEKTPGYTRQRVDVHSLSISSHTYWQTRLSKLSLAGQGVSAFGVSQIRNDYLDRRYRDMAPIAKEYDTKIKIMLELETALDSIDNFGLLDAFHKLKSTLQQVSLERPDALEMTSLVRNQAENICRMLRAYSNDLYKLLESNLDELQGSIKGANDLIEKIVVYNKAIQGEYLLDAGRIMSGRGVSEYGPLQLLDERNLLLDQLAEYGNIEVFQNANGSVRVTMAGVTIIDDQHSERIVMRDYHDFNAAYLTFSNGIEFRPKNGEIKAFMDMVNGNGPYATGDFQNGEYGIPYYIQALDAFAEGFAALMNQVNKGNLSEYQAWNRNLLWGGYELDGDGNRRVLTDNDGNQIFGENGETLYRKATVTAANIRVSDEWMNNVLMIGETFSERSIVNYATGATYNVGEVFKDPVSGRYFIVKEQFVANGVATSFIRDGKVQDIPVYYDSTPPSPDYDRNHTDYAQDDVFFDPVTGIYYRVTQNHIPGMNIPNLADAMAAGAIEAIGVHQGEWQRANLNGSNLHRFVLALETNQSWGRAFDFHGSVYGYLEFISDRLGSGISYLENSFNATMDVINILLDNRDAISAVSETEEGINMLTYQKWFNASARLMTTMDEALDVIINRMGRVGL